MKYILADKSLLVAGRCFEGFPLLIGPDGRRMEPAQDFLWDVIASNGRIESKRSWDVYGRAMYDYFAFVMTNGLDWKAPAQEGIPTALEAWRDWSLTTAGLSKSTINHRLRTIHRFYQWAVLKKHLAELPFEYNEVHTLRTDPGFLAHVDRRGGRVASPQFMLKQPKEEIRFLSKEQLAVGLADLRERNLTHALMFELMARTGLRQIEMRTFPDAYVFDPSRRKDLDPARKIRVAISPRDMEIKWSKPREIDVPYDLMERLWEYSLRHRQRRANNRADGQEFPHLFLTEQGKPYTKQAVGDIFRKLAHRVGFEITAHMLRHSYATYLLWSLRKSKTFEGEPLLYVRDRMGHSDVSTTTVYLHLINRLEGSLVLAHEDEIDAIFTSRHGPAEGTHSDTPRPPQEVRA